MLYNKLQSLASAAVTASLLSASNEQTQKCSSTAIPLPSIPDGQVLDFSAFPGWYGNNSVLNFCNITVTYTHPCKNDTIHVTVWLPLSGWNGRLQGSGGGGYAMRQDDSRLANAVALNYSVVATDGGHDMEMLNSISWSLDASNNVNMQLLKDFAYIALNDAALIGKQITHSFYGRGPQYSYWNGCSTGGRQGLMLAQRYPTAYDGILAACPAINWPSFVVAEYWPLFVMHQLRTYPPKCVTDAITSETIEACDMLDGVKDGVISDPDLCKFDPEEMEGRTINCDGTPVRITRNDTLVVKKIWEGPRSADGSFLWYGPNKGTHLNMGWTWDSLAPVTSETPSVNITGLPFNIASDWISRFVLQEPLVNLNKLSHHYLDIIFALSKIKYDAIIATDNPNLSAFKASGGKMISWHGLTDQQIFPKGTEHYYRQAEALDPFIRDFFRYFPAPGADHCFGGVGPVPVDPLGAIIKWVEKGIAPETLPASDSNGRSHNLCPYPLVSVYKGEGHDPKKAESYTCKKSFTEKEPTEHDLL